jgi:hypothetical protein
MSKRKFGGRGGGGGGESKDIQTFELSAYRRCAVRTYK